MITTPKNFLVKSLLFLCLAAISFFATGVSTAKAQTADTSGVSFTSIPTAADSIAMRKKAQAAVVAKAKTTVAVPATKGHQDLWLTFLTGFLGGFLAFLMPCVYPLLPLTVSFFTKLGGSKAKAAGLALFYMLSIIVIYVGLGMLLTIFFGPDTLNNIATNGIFNIVIFLLLIVFGISFLGAFEITLPGSLANKVDTMSDKGGIIGIFFMALTLVIVSFSCTAGVVATALSDAFSKGDRLAPAISMLGFSTALGLPFAIFALFPSAMSSLPKSGGWLNSIKVVLGLFELAFALKYLSNVDLAYHWNWLDREVFLSLWIAIGVVMGLYLIGKIKFSHDSDLKYMSVPRLFIAIVTFAFVIYMVPGLWGAPLKSISAFLPPIATQDFDLSKSPDGGGTSTSVQNIPTGLPVKKYEANYSRLKVRGLDAWYDYDQALQVSKILHKPIIIDFTGFACVNCRKMEADVWTDPSVFSRLKQDYILLQLVVDDKAALDQKEQFVSTYSGKKITTLGGKWSDLEASRFNANAQPYYILLDSDGNVLNDANGKAIPPSPANYDKDSYLKFLDSGISAYQAQQGKK
jgi:thiol:disulfide interchange protein DsbD